MSKIVPAAGDPSRFEGTYKNLSIQYENLPDFGPLWTELTGEPSQRPGPLYVRLEDARPDSIVAVLLADEGEVDSRKLTLHFQDGYFVSGIRYHYVNKVVVVNAVWAHYWGLAVGEDGRLNVFRSSEGFGFVGPLMAGDATHEPLRFTFERVSGPQRHQAGPQEADRRTPPSPQTVP
jgi:hypothetical protein